MNITLKKEVHEKLNETLNSLRNMGFKVSERIDMSIDNKDLYGIGSHLPIQTTQTFKGKIEFVIPDSLIEVSK